MSPHSASMMLSTRPQLTCIDCSRPSSARCLNGPMPTRTRHATSPVAEHRQPDHPCARFAVRDGSPRRHAVGAQRRAGARTYLGRDQAQAPRPSGTAERDRGLRPCSRSRTYEADASQLGELALVNAPPAVGRSASQAASRARSVFPAAMGAAATLLIHRTPPGSQDRPLSTPIVPGGVAISLPEPILAHDHVERLDLAISAPDGPGSSVTRQASDQAPLVHPPRCARKYRCRCSPCLGSQQTAG